MNPFGCSAVLKANNCGGGRYIPTNAGYGKAEIKHDIVELVAKREGLGGKKTLSNYSTWPAVMGERTMRC